MTPNRQPTPFPWLPQIPGPIIPAMFARRVGPATLPRRLIQSLLPAALATLTLQTLLGCAGGTPSAATPASTPTPPALLALPGNWQMQIQSTPGTTTTGIISILNFGPVLAGALSVQGATVHGTLHFVVPPFLGTPPNATTCVSPKQDITFTGTTDATDLLTLTSAQFSGNTAILTLQLPLDLNRSANGTLTVAGGSCAEPSTSLLGYSVPSVTGTYTGTVSPTSPFGQTSPSGGVATVVLAQAAANEHGQFVVTGSLTLSSPACNLATTLTGLTDGSSLSLSQTIASDSATTFTPPLFANFASPFFPGSPASPTSPAFPIADRLLSFFVPPGIATCTSGTYLGQLRRQ